MSNILDKKLSEYRKAVLKHIVDEGEKLRKEATDIDESLKDIEGLIREIKQLQIEVWSIVFRPVVFKNHTTLQKCRNFKKYFIL